MARKEFRAGIERERAGAFVANTDRRSIVAPSDRLCAVTDVGRVRDHNEDLFYVVDDGRVMIVADGMGGHAAGEVASALAVEAINTFLEAQRQELVDGRDSAGRVMLAALDAAQRRVMEESEGPVTGQAMHMGCALILARLQGDRLDLCHVGDVRCYVRSADGFRQVTRDHSVVAALIDGGQITADQARVHPKKNEVLQAIGMPGGITPDLNAVNLRPGDRVLLCSDGLWEALPAEEIGELVGGDGSMRQLATQLVDRANSAAGLDNITVVLYRHTDVGNHLEPATP